MGNIKRKLTLAGLVCLTFFGSLQLAAQSKDVFNAPLAEFTGVPAGAIYNDVSKTPEQRAQDVVNRLTFEELTTLFGGYKHFNMAGVPRLGLRHIVMADAGQGIRSVPKKRIKTTSYPATVALAATWNPEVANLMGASIGTECRLWGVDILLGPGINMQRLSVSGRNFEYMGEDPLLTSKMVVEYVKGVQSKNVIATAKHFIGNDQEFCRHISDSHIDERTLREIYMPAWKAVIQEGGLKGIMAGNNACNGIHGSMDEQYLQNVVRDEWGFKGITMTDWQNTNYFPKSQYLFLNSGMTLLMPDNKAFMKFLASNLKQYPHKKDEVMEILRHKVYCNLLPVFESGLYDMPLTDKLLETEMPQNKVNACTIAEEAITLLKNEDNILPLSRKSKVLLMGDKRERHSGLGSGFVRGYDHVSYADGLASLSKKLTVSQDFNEEEIKNADVIIYNFNILGSEGLDVPFEEGQNDEIAKIAAINPNVVVVVNGANGLPMQWLDKVKGVLWCYYLGQERGNALANVIFGKVNPSGKLPFTLEKDFADSPDPDFNHIGGKPFWYGDNSRYKNYWLQNGLEVRASDQFKDNIRPYQLIPINYDEGVFMGYRWWDKTGSPIYFPFGHGLSYTNFEYQDIKLSSQNITGDDELQVSFTIKNTGKVSGKEVVQLYIADKVSSVDRPLKELKHFDKIELKAGESKTISFTITKQDLAFWDIDESGWKAEQGKFEILIGSSSRDIRLKKSFSYE